MSQERLLPRFFSYFEPTKTPLYFIVIIGIATLIYTANFEIPPVHWGLMCTLIALVVLICILMTFIERPIDDEEYDKQLMFVRSLGISSALICLIIAGESVLKQGPLYVRVFVPATIQVVVFIFYLFAKDQMSSSEEIDPPAVKIRKKKRVHYLQLCLITTATLVGITTNTFWEQKVIPDKPDISARESEEFLASNADEVFDSSAEAIGLMRENVGEAEFDKINTAIDQLAEFHREWVSFKDKVERDSSRTQGGGIISEEYKRRVVLNWLFLFFWGLCMYVWIRNLYLNVKFTIQVKGDFD